MSRRRRKRSAAARLRRFWIVGLVLVLILGAAGWYLATWPALYPKHVVVVGNAIVSRQEILQRAAIDRHRNLWLQDTAAMTRRIEAIPYVLQADVERALPAEVTIVVAERTPYAVVTSFAGTALVDRNLRVVETDTGRNDLPRLNLGTAQVFTLGEVLSSDRAVTLRDDAAALQATRIRVTSVSLDKYDQGVARLASGIDVLLGDDADLPRKAALVKPILAQVATGGRRVAAIDLRAPATPILVYAK